MSETMRHRIVIVGGGSAGIDVAARLRRAREDDVVVIEPSDRHYYQPLWTLVGAGAAPARITERREADVMPAGVQWIRDHATEIDPVRREVATRGGRPVGYDALVVAPGIQLDWDGIPGVAEAIESGAATSNYGFDLAPRTWRMVRELRGGTALFTTPTGPYKCGGASQKAVYMTCDALRRRGLLGATHAVYQNPGDVLFGIPEFAATLEGVMARYGVDVRLQRELVEVRGDAREAVLAPVGGGEREVIPYDFLHVVPPQSAPDFLKRGPLAVSDDPKGWVDVDRETLQHRRYPEVFALGDCANLPTGKTGAAVRKQAPVVVANVLAHLDGLDLPRRYDGYASCPLVTGYGKMVLAEFDYSGTMHPTIPLIDTTKERYDMWLLKRYGLPFLYWNFMLKGLA